MTLEDNKNLFPSLRQNHFQEHPIKSLKNKSKGPALNSMLYRGDTAEGKRS